MFQWDIPNACQVNFRTRFNIVRNYQERQFRMSIKNIKERLEGSYRLIRIKRIKLGFYAIEMVLGLVLAFTMSFLMGARFEPFYFPIDMFTFIILIMVLLITIEGIYFKGLEIKYTRNKSRRFLLARNAIRRSLAIIGLSGLVILLLMLPFSQEKLVETYAPTSDGWLNVPAGEIYRESSFECQDRLGLTRASFITIDLQSDTCSVFLVLERNETDPYSSNFWQSTFQSDTYNFGDLESHSDLQNSIYVIFSNPGPTDVSFRYSVTSDTSPILSLYIPALALAFIIVQFAAISIMFPIRETYASSSIYSKKYVAPTDSGEYSFSELRKTKKEQEEEDMLEKALDVELPAPKPIKAAPKPEAQKSPVVEAPKARVDDGLIEEPDIQCTACGEMNSAHSAMCFSCGTPMKAMEKVAIDPSAYLKKGVSFANAGRYDDAISCYDEALKHDGTNETALLRKGEALHKLGKWGSAVQYVNTALKVNPKNVETLVLKAKILEERDRFDKSMEIYSQILALDPDNAFAMSKMQKVSQKFVIAVEEAEIGNVEDVLEQFMCVPGIGLARATALYEAGFTSMEMLKTASEDKLAEVKGISKGIAKKIKKGLEGL
ncbi:MAG: tetratricopeptide repeat protein [Thermoplasmata archaeon]|nr:tetratricopeptide repeat protein [Thermoplasmata archaeon]